MNTSEKVNAAILEAEAYARAHGPAWARDNARHLAEHWQANYWARPWRTLVPAAQGDVLRRYVAWYARLFLALGKPRALVSPMELAPDVAADQLRAIAEASQATGKSVADVAEGAANAAANAGDALADAAAEAFRRIDDALQKALLYAALGAAIYVFAVRGSRK